MIALLAVLLMPLGMAPAAAMSNAAHHASAMPMQHCPEQGSKHSSKEAFAECTMACSAALPAAEVARGEPLLIVCLPVQPTTAQQLHGVHPETATPPPKRS